MVMLMHLLTALLLVQGPGGGSIGENRFILRDPVQGPMQVTDKDLRPMKAPDCRTEEETQRAVAQVKNGEPGECFVRDLRAFKSR